MRREEFVLTGAALAGVAAFGAGRAIARADAEPSIVPSPLLEPPTMLTPAQMLADIAAFADTLVEVGPDPFYTSSRAAFDVARTEAEESCAQPQSSSAFALAMGQLTAALNDGHVSVINTPYDWNSPVFPLLLSVDYDNALITVNPHNLQVPAGSRILSIGNRSADDLVSRTLAVTGGQTPALRRAFARPNEILYLLDGASPNYDVSFVTPMGVAGHAQLDAGTRPTFHRRPYVFTLTHDAIAVIRYNMCYDRTAFASFLLQAFTRVRDDCARAVVIDIRNNGGGNSNVTDALWPYLGGSPCEGTMQIRCRVSNRLKREYGPERYAEIYGQRALSAQDGTIITDRESGKFTLETTPLRATVPKFFLIGPNTFSSGNKCAFEASLCRFATLVGEETAEPVDTTGEVYLLALPNSSLRVSLTTKTFSFDGYANGQTVKPDIVAPRTVRDYAIGKDPAMDAVRQRLGPSSCPTPTG
ncbi:MAG TPA: S41 family peptidase [Candidatus Acidoferrales bacterium]|nr:S41 family peptidase [Candidatus Acidoferrales bacterium]